MQNQQQVSTAINALQKESLFFRSLLEGEVNIFNKYFDEAKNDPTVSDEVLQFWAKTGVRLLSAQIEAMLNIVKRVALVGAPIATVPLSEGDRAMLREESFDVSNTGATKSRPAKISLLDNIRFTVRIFTIHYGGTHQIDFSGADWQRFQRAIRVREKLMHPKSIADLVISLNEYNDVTESWVWFATQVGQLIGSVGQPRR